MDGDLVISPLLDTGTEVEITALEDGTATELSEDNEDVLCAIAGLELLFIDIELPMSAMLETAIGEDFISEDE